MAEIVKMPKLSDTMKEGVVAKWHKKVGDKVKSGEILAEIETDKATMDFESFYDGVLLYIGIEEGKGAPIDAVLAVIGNKDENVEAILQQQGAGKETQSTPQEEHKTATPESASKPDSVSSATANKTESGRIKVSPLARKIAKEKGIDLNALQGSGDEGRIIKRDVENYSPSASPNVVQMGIAGKESYNEVPVSQMRKTIARRLAESKFSAPHFYLKIDVDMTQAMEARKSINNVSPVKVSFNDMVVKAVSIALRSNPKINSSWLGEKIRYNQHINIGVAMAVEDGLLVPVVRFADMKSLSQIASEVKELGVKAKDKKLQPTDWEGNTFTISNLGMFGIDEFTAIINPPDACILAVGGIKETAVVKNGQLAVGNIMKLTLSCDHRVVDGATGAAFLQTLKGLLENPVTMLV
ncbi:MAG: pyruvate dehydrogenase complex dihydrolipoamide acetyltransferase [Bacteroidia bacterium]|nr:pyruvate dehydrogenase complex dihydrolipoamide acetyltransferase [Bacteroidia bacterium]